jgi:hypothetical protein
MGLTALYERLQSELMLHGAQYKLYIKAATVAVLFYIALTDFLTFKIRNDLIVLLLILYALFAFVTRSPIEVLTDIALALVIFAVLLWFYSQGAVGGGDVKLVTVACVWVGTHCTLLFAALSAATELTINGRFGAGSHTRLVIHRYARLGPQDCFLMPDVIVAIDALGPYCSSPRGYYHHYRRY